MTSEMPRFSPALSTQVTSSPACRRTWSSQGCLTIRTAVLICSQPLLRGVFLPFGEEIPNVGSEVWWAGVRSKAEHLVWDFRNAACMFDRSISVTARLTSRYQNYWKHPFAVIIFFFLLCKYASDCPSCLTNPRKRPCPTPYSLYLFRWKIMICGALVMVAFTAASCLVPHQEQWIWLFQVSVSCWKKHLRQSCQRKKNIYQSFDQTDLYPWRS